MIFRLVSHINISWCSAKRNWEFLTVVPPQHGRKVVPAAVPALEASSEVSHYKEELQGDHAEEIWAPRTRQPLPKPFF